jgi:hypothetical protein
MENLGKTLGKYVISIGLFVMGLVFLVKYFSGDALEKQPIMLLISSLILLAVAVLMTPTVLEKLSGSISRILGYGAAVLALFLGYQVYSSVDSELVYQEKKKQYDEVVIQKLKDIRSIEEAYEDVYGVFTTNFDTLLNFVHKPVVAIPFKAGTFHDSLPEDRSLELGYVITRAEVDSVAALLGASSDDLLSKIELDMSVWKIRDTIYTTFFDENFTPEKRKAKKMDLVNLDSLTYSPLSGVRFDAKMSSIEVGGVNKATLEVKDPTPFGQEGARKDTLKFGSLTEPHLDGNWK